jgi:hypothetical protein
VACLSVSHQKRKEKNDFFKRFEASGKKLETDRGTVGSLNSKKFEKKKENSFHAT